MVCREKEMAHREKEMEREIHAVKMQMKEEQLQMTDRMARLELSLQYERKESLRASYRFPHRPRGIKIRPQTVSP